VSMELQERNKKEEEDKVKKKEQQWQIMKNPLRTSLPESEKPTPFGQWTEVKERFVCINYSLAVNYN
jgi:hypothetical protein